MAMRLVGLVLVGLLWWVPAHATVIFQENGESYVDEQLLTNPPWCNTDCGGSAVNSYAEERASCDPASTAPTGNICFRHPIAANELSHFYVLKPSAAGFNHVLAEGDVIWLAFQENYTRISGLDVWHDGGNTSQNHQSGDKGVELQGDDTADFRWVVGHGQWDSLCWNTDHKWTVWVGNPTNHFNPSIEVSDAIRPNVSPYGAACSPPTSPWTSAPQLDYERWYNIVFEIKFADASPKNGYVKLYVNGTLILEYIDIQTANTFAGGNIVLDQMDIGGTIAQAAYDAPAHTRYYDNFVLATTAAEVSAFMVDPESSDTTPPAPPTGVRVD